MSYNELFGLGSHSEDASLEGWWPLQDNAASTAVDDVSSNNRNGTLQGGDNTADITTTGPNNWLTAALDLDGTADYITASAAPADYPFSLVGHQYNNTPGTGNDSAWAVADASEIDDYFAQRIANGSAAIQVVRRNASAVVTNLGATAATDTWTHVGIAFVDATTVRGYVNGSQTLNDSGLTSLACSTGLDTTVIGALKNNAPNDFFDGAVAGVALFSRELSSTEMAEVDAGPEPVNTVAPALSGTELVGETLTATSGTWALDAPFSGGSNGTVTYSYQWTRSNDNAGTGEADISGATSSTYVLTSSDAGKYVRCRVRGTNDGGFDADADTNTAMSGKIATNSLLANLIGHFKKDETSGTVVRNDVRTLLLEDDFDSGSTSGTYGDVPTGWSEYGSGISSYSTSLASGVITITADGESTSTGVQGFLQNNQFTVGKQYVAIVRIKRNSHTGSPVIQIFNGAWETKGISTIGTSFETVAFNLGVASDTTLRVAVSISPNTEAAEIEIDSITIYEENAGTYVNSPTLGVPGKVGTAVTYNGTTQYANCPVAPTSYPFTMAGWCKPGLANEATIFSVTDASANNAYLAMLVEETSGDLEIYRRNTTQIVDQAGVSLSAGVWVHVAAVFEDATTVHVYVDGSLVFSDGGLTSVTLPAGADALAIGVIRLTSASNYFDGSIDDIRLYSRGLSPTEVYAVYSAALSQPNEFDSMAIGLSIGL